MKLAELLNGLDYTCTAGLNITVDDIVYDSRKTGPGRVFVCLKGSNTDGHAFAAQAAKAGAAAIVAEDKIEAAGAPVVYVPSTRLALAAMSATLFRHPTRELLMVGITGTKGKTTCAYMVRSILEAAGIKTGIIGTIGITAGDNTLQTNNTTPESYEIQKALRWMADQGCKAAVLEASSIGLRDHRLASVPFDVGLFTNFSEDHIGGAEHKDMKEYLACKSLLFRQCKTGVVNLDDANWKGVLEGHTCNYTTYGFAREAKIRAENETLISRPGYLGVHFDLESEDEAYGVDVGIPGKFSVYNALASISVCRLLGCSQEAIQQGLKNVKVKGRVEPVPVPGDYTLLIDYAHNAVSMESILRTLREYHPTRLVCLFGAGGNRSRTRRYEMGEVSGRLADLSVITADNSRFEDVMDIIQDILVGMKKTDGKYTVIPDRKEAIRYCIQHALPGDIIVLAGKGHEDYQEIKGVKYHFDEREIVADILAE